MTCGFQIFANNVFFNLKNRLQLMRNNCLIGSYTSDLLASNGVE